jgi:hypothetical protein
VTDNQGGTDTESIYIFTLGPPYDETEPNDSKATAQDLPAFPFTHLVGETADGDEDWYKFTVAGGPKYLCVEVHGTYNDTVLFAEDGSTLLETSSFDGKYETLVHQCANGTYYLRRSTSPGYPSASYFIAADLVTSFPVAELSGEKLSSAAIQGNWVLVSKVEAFKLPAAMENTGFKYGCTIDWDFDNDGFYDQPVYPNQWVHQVFYMQMGSVTCRATVTPPDGSPTESTQDFLCVGTSNEDEPNDLPGTAQHLTLESRKMADVDEKNWKHGIRGAIGDSSPGGSVSDWYRYEIPDGGAVAIVVARWRSLTRFGLTIHGPDGTSVRATLPPDGGFYNGMKLIDYPTEPGIYYVELETDSATAWNAGGYGIAGFYEKADSGG